VIYVQMALRPTGAGIVHPTAHWRTSRELRGGKSKSHHRQHTPVDLCKNERRKFAEYRQIAFRTSRTEEHFPAGIPALLTWR
jgi:hypothetical protein